MNIVAYDRAFGRDHFSCGHASLDNYIRLNVTKDVKAGACTCFVVADDHYRVMAFYTLSTAQIPLADAPDALRNQIRYPSVPVILLGRLAVHDEMKGRGYGKMLLVDALKRSLDVARNHIGAMAVVVDPIDQAAEAFYARFGFTMLPDSGRMFMTMRKIAEAFDHPLPPV